MRRQVESQQRKARIMGLIKGGLGTPVLTGIDQNQATIVDNGVGDYSIVPAEPFGDDQLCAVATSLTEGVNISLGTVVKASIQVLCWSDLAQATPAEGDFHIQILGSDISDRT